MSRSDFIPTPALSAIPCWRLLPIVGKPYLGIIPACPLSAGWKFLELGYGGSGSAGKLISSVPKVNSSTCQRCANYETPLIEQTRGGAVASADAYFFTSVCQFRVTVMGAVLPGP